MEQNYKMKMIHITKWLTCIERNKNSLRDENDSTRSSITNSRARCVQRNYVVINSIHKISWRICSQWCQLILVSYLCHTANIIYDAFLKTVRQCYFIFLSACSSLYDSVIYHCSKLIIAMLETRMLERKRHQQYPSSSLSSYISNYSAFFIIPIYYFCLTSSVFTLHPRLISAS